MYENNMKINTKNIVEIIKNRLESKQIKLLGMSKDVYELFEKELKEEIIFTNSEELGIITHIKGVEVFINSFVTPSVVIIYGNKDIFEVVYIYNNNNSTKELRSEILTIDNWNPLEEYESIFEEG